MIARHRPRTPIFAVTVKEQTQRRLALVWGVESAVVGAAPTTETMVAAGLAAAVDHQWVVPGDLVVMVRAREASLAMLDVKFVPIDLAIVGVVDELEVKNGFAFEFKQGWTQYT